MKNTPQVLLISEGADQFAIEQGLDTLITHILSLKERTQLQKINP